MTRLLLALGTLFLAFSSYSQTLTELQTFRGSDTPNGTGTVLTRFGHTMDIDGNTLVVTEPYNGGGVAYVFELVNNQWTEVAKLTSSDNVFDDDFGLSVAIDGDVIAIGAPNKEAATTLEGAVYIYEKPLSGWASSTETIKLVSPRAGSIASFGSSVDLNGDELLIGASREDVGAVANPGRIYIYTRTTSSWTSAALEAELTSTTIGAGDQLGLSASFEDDYIVSSALTGSNAGTLHVYEKPASGTWANATIEDKLLLSATRSMDDRLGGIVHASGDFIITSSADDPNVPMVYQPHLHIFHRSTGKWSTETNMNEVVRYELPSYFNLPAFGTTAQGDYDVKTIGNILLIGNASSFGTTNTNLSGSLLITRFGTQASDLQTIVEVDGTDLNSSGMFGGAIAISGSKLLVSSIREDIGGVVRFFDFSYSTSSTQDLCAGQSIVFGSQTINSSGIYNETFTSVEGLDSLVTLTVSVSDLSISTSHTDNVCFGENNGEINVGASGGSGPYTYSIDGTNFGSTPSFSFLAAGNYTVHIRDTNGCELSENVTIEEPNQLALDLLTVIDAECFGEASGVINVSAIGGTGAVEFSTDGTNFATAPLTAVAAGTYDITARDQNGCEVTIAINVDVNEPLATLRPSISGGNSTTYGTELENLIVLPNASDTEISHFELFGLNGGSLFKSDGTTAINEGDFITVAEGQEGLVFDPTASGNANFTMRSAAADRQACVNTLADITQMISIADAPLEIAVRDETISYGSNPSLTLDYTGFVNGEDQAVFITDPIITNSVSSATTPGMYPASVSGAVAPNYSITYSGGTITVSKASLLVEGTDAMMNYGDASLPAFDFTYSGFVNGEDDSVLDSAPSSVGTTATADSDAGTYPISVSQDGADDAYNFVYSDGELTINKVNLVATADDKTINEDEALPTFTISYDGFVNAEDVSVLDVAPTATVSIANSAISGVYAITPGGGSDNNYDFTFVNGELTINEVLSALDNLPEVIVYPNPTADRLSFDQLISKVEILSIDGKVLIASEEVKSLEVSTLATGTYLIRLIDNNDQEIMTSRFVKQ